LEHNQSDYNQRLIDEFRADRSNNGGAFNGRPLLLLTTTGARSGKRHTTPMMYVPDGERLLVIASNAGAPGNPAWYYNLMAHPLVTVEVGKDTYDATATVTEGEERQRLWTMIVEHRPFFADHQAKITRQIPVIALERKKG
jgi:deazaflavin-dependent oxidoreductase (nitroreductase family)